MSFAVNASVTRDLLGLGNLNINDHVNYTLASGIMSGQVSWDRQQASSQWIDGDVTVSRRRGNVTEPITLYVRGGDHGELISNVHTAIEAFSQDAFGLAIVINGEFNQYQCESADYSVDWGYVLHSNMTILKFQVLRSPLPIRGL